MADVERLNQMLRETGYGQGQIDAYVAQCELLDRLQEILSQVPKAPKRGDCCTAFYQGIAHGREQLAQEILEVLNA